MNNEEWKDHYSMMKRWFYRLQGLGGGVDNLLSLKGGYSDAYWAFFVSCYHLKDYLKDIGCTDVEKYINRTEALRVCADVCNRTKHGNSKEKKRPPREDESIVGHEHLYLTHIVDPYDGMTRSVAFSHFDIESDTKKYDSFKLACACVDAWNSYLSDKKLEIPELMEEKMFKYFPKYKGPTDNDQ